MKNFLLIVITLITTLLNAQNYTPFSGNKGWCIEESANLGYWPLPFYYQKDTVINSVIYGKYYSSFDFEAGFFREDMSNGKVYRYTTNSILNNFYTIIILMREILLLLILIITALCYLLFPVWIPYRLQEIGSGEYILHTTIQTYIRRFTG